MQIPKVLETRRALFFQRFTPEEVYKHSNDSVYLSGWCTAIKQLYRKALLENKIIIPDEYIVRDTAKKFSKSYDPGIVSMTRAFVELTENKLPPIPRKETSETMSANTQLYIVKDTNQYVTRIGTNSANNAVVEEKATGKIFDVTPDRLEKVLPYTVAVRFQGNQTIYHYIADKALVDKGDVLMKKDLSGFAVVTDVNTKSEAATTQLVSHFHGKLALTTLKE